VSYTLAQLEVQQPTLETQRLVLRPFTLNDAPEVQRLVGERDIAAVTQNIPYPYEDGEAQKWIKTHSKAFITGIGANFAIVLKENGLLCGAIGLVFDKVNNNAEIGYWIGKPFWGKGYCTEAALAVLQYGFETIGLHRIHSGHFSHNPASGRVMQKIGMKYEGCRRQDVIKWVNYVDLELYGILKSDWEQKNEQTWKEVETNDQ
jgi:[ribosomal protein S5]-alanine N-acetyltransferase